MRQHFITAQNRSSYGKGSYKDTPGPSSKSPKDVSCQTGSRSVVDVESPRSDDVPLSPLSVVHVRRDFEVTSAVAKNSGDTRGIGLHEKMFS
jgi:hypothetical protein